MARARIEAVRGYLAHGCPFGAQAAADGQVAIIEMQPTDLLAAPRQAMQAMRAPQTQAAVVVALHDHDTHERCRAEAIDILGLLIHAALGDGVSDHPAAVEASILSCREAIAHPYVRAGIPLDRSYLVPFALSPARPVFGPRYAPHLCVVALRLDQLAYAAVAQRGAVAELRRKMKLAAGRPYDADAFYVGG